MPSQEVMLINKLGLHARAAGKFVTVAKAHQAKVVVAAGNNEVDGKSIMSIMLLAASVGSKLTLTTEGEDANEALQALVGLIEGRFGEDE